MSPELTLEWQIEQLKESLENAAEQHKYNFHHPSVLQISETLDELIVQVMKRINGRSPQLTVSPAPPVPN